MITDRVPAKLHGVTGEDPEYWGLAGMVTDEMADVAMKMKVRKPKTFAQIQKLTGMEPEKLQKLLDEMSRIGLIEYHWENLDGKNPNHEKRYVLPMFVPGSAEFFNMNHTVIEEHPEVTAFFERMTILPQEKITPKE
ncbi:MAG: pyridine nucleotide-disulfide oxidoreductase, partial [Oscillospiraceae bacterium]|nr:pyridine nucleotide-disulfide oxidoreductase [Oscillospiraceae bacterium]